MARLIQDADIKGSAQVTSDTRLINADKIYSTSLGKRLDQAISAGDFGSLDSPVFAENYTLTASVASNALTIALKTKAGTDPSSSDPVKVAFRGTTNSSGSYSVLSITSALSLTVSSGSTLGHTSGNEHPIWVYIFDDSGTPRLGVSQALFTEAIVRSSTAEGGAGAADSNRVIYTGTAVSSKPLRIIARLMSTQTTAGTWASVPSKIILHPKLEQSYLAHYEANAGQSIPNNTLTTVDFSTKLIDVLNTVTTGGSWSYTCPVDGDYFCSVEITFDNGSGWDAGEEALLSFDKNGSVHTIVHRNEPQTSTSSRISLIGSSVFRGCVTGDAIRARVSQASGASRALLSTSQYNQITIFKLPGREEL